MNEPRANTHDYFTLLLLHLSLSLTCHSFTCIKKQADASGYDPKRSKVSDKTMANWRQLQITGDLKEVPGIGDAAVQKLAMGATEAERITNTYQLFGMVCV